MTRNKFGFSYSRKQCNFKIELLLNSQVKISALNKTPVPVLVLLICRLLRSITLRKYRFVRPAIIEQIDIIH